MSFIVKSRAATLAEVVPNAPNRCPACHRRVRTKFSAFYFGNPTQPETVALAAWRCNRCWTVHAL